METKRYQNADYKPEHYTKMCIVLMWPAVKMDFNGDQCKFGCYKY